jgi:predicted XRE-type DNA-binding protein
VKIRSVAANNRRRAFEVETRTGTYALPYSVIEPAPTRSDRIRRVYVDEELGREGFTWVLASGAEGSVHVDSVLEYNEDPAYLRDLIVHRLTIEAERCVEASGLSRREIIRRTGTSPAQFYRLLDPANTSKSVDKLLVLLSAVGYEVDFSVRPLKRGQRQRRSRPDEDLPSSAA